MSPKDGQRFLQRSNPSAWHKRIVLLIMAAVGFLIALYLGLYQLHIFKSVWEPFFGNGTDAVVKSSFSRSLPIPDALVGALGYLFDIILVSIGTETRWKSKPTVVILYSIVVAIMALGSIVLIILQAFVLHAWCTLCLSSAALSIGMVIPVAKEFIATMQNKKMKKL